MNSCVCLSHCPRCDTLKKTKDVSGDRNATLRSHILIAEGEVCEFLRSVAWRRKELASDIAAKEMKKCRPFTIYFWFSNNFLKMTSQKL